jgi:cleavage stimulation factor subunit 3
LTGLTLIEHYWLKSLCALEKVSSPAFLCTPITKLTTLHQMDATRFARVQELVSILEVDAPITDERRLLFEEFLSIYSTYPPIWRQYIDSEIRANDRDRVTKLFYRALPNVPDVKLFQKYLDFVRRTTASQAEICAAYEYAIQHVGLDMGAIMIYSDYVDFAAGQASDVVPIDKLRKVYKAALSVPMDGLRDFFSNYRAFEERKSGQLARSILPDQERLFKGTAQVYHQKKRFQRELQSTLCILNDAGFDSIHRWRIFIEYEKGNPLMASPDQRKAFVVFAYKCALTTLRFCSLIWHEYAQFLTEIGDSNEALAVYAQAVKILPENLLLHFTYTELLESRKRAAEAGPIYRALIERLTDPPKKTLATIHLLKFVQRTEGPAAMRREFICALQEGKCTYHLILAVASIENLVNVNRGAALRILMLGVDTYGSSPEFLEAVIRELIRMNAGEEVRSVLTRALDVVSEEKMLDLYHQFYSHLLFVRGNDELLADMEHEILRFDRKESADTMTLRRFFLPTDFVDAPDRNL